MPLGELRIVKTCMVAQRAAIEVVAQNIANAATPCYTRQRPVLTPIAATQMVDPTKAGQGVSLDYVQRLTDTRLQARINLQRGMYQQAQTLSFGLERIEGVVGDMDEGMQSALTDFFNAWDDLGADGNNLGARARVVSTGQALADALHAHRATLQSLAGDIEGQFNDLVARANALLERVAELNKQAMGNEGRMGGNMAAVQRDQACQELAELLGATTLAQPDGSLSVLISGLQVVDVGTASRVELVADPADPSIHHLSIQGHVDPGVSESWLSPTLGQVQGITGQALALLQIRDQYMPAYLQRLDEFAGVLAEAVNTRHQLGFDLNGDPGQHQRGRAGGLRHRRDQVRAALRHRHGRAVCGRPDGAGRSRRGRGSGRRRDAGESPAGARGQVPGAIRGVGGRGVRGADEVPEGLYRGHAGGRGGQRDDGERAGPGVRGSGRDGRAAPHRLRELARGCPR